MQNGKFKSLAKRTDFLLTNNFKATTTFCMSFVAIFLAIITQSETVSLLASAIVVSTLAALILMNYRNIPDYHFGNDSFYVGMGLFAIVHLLYIKLFMGKLHTTYTIRQMSTSVFLFLCITAYSIAIAFIFSCKKSNVFRYAVIGYVCLICTSMLSMYSCAEAYGGKYIMAAVGITCFFISDFFLFLRETISDTPWVSKLVWVFYPIGQFLIIFSVV